MRLERFDGRLVIVTGPHWHARLGPVLVSWFRPASEQPWADVAWLTLMVGDGVYPRREEFVGWALRSPRLSFGASPRSRLGGLVGAVQQRTSAREAARRRQQRAALGLDRNLSDATSASSPSPHRRATVAGGWHDGG